MPSRRVQIFKRKIRRKFNDLKKKTCFKEDILQIMLNSSNYFSKYRTNLLIGLLRRFANLKLVVVNHSAMRVSYNFSLTFEIVLS